MKRIVAALTKKAEACKAERKEKRIMRAIEIAKDNAQDRIEEAEAKMAKIVEELPEREEPNAFVTDLSVLLDDIETQEAVIKRLDTLKAYLDEDIKVEK